MLTERQNLFRIFQQWNITIKEQHLNLPQCTIFPLLKMLQPVITQSTTLHQMASLSLDPFFWSSYSNGTQLSVLLDNNIYSSWEKSQDCYNNDIHPFLFSQKNVQQDVQNDISIHFSALPRLFLYNV